MTKQLLAIDDESSILTIIQLCLESFEGWQVTPCTPAQVLGQIPQASWDAILLEVAANDGQKVFEQLQAQPSTRCIPVVFVTSRVMPLEMAHYNQLGAAGIIPKPFDPKQLGTEISKKLGWATCVAV